MKAAWAVLLLISAAPCAAADAQDQRSCGENPWSRYRFAPDAIQEIDLASDTAWTLSVDDRPARPIKVTAGGWNSDRQEPEIRVDAVKDHVVYQRPIAIPAAAKGNVVKLLFGGCNYGAEVWLDEQKVGEHHGPMTPFAVDLTGVAAPGRTHGLRVKAWHRVHYGTPPIVPVPFDFNAGVSNMYSGHTKFAYGLTGHVRLAIYPPLHIADLFVRPSVGRDQLEVRVWTRNAAAQDKRVTLRASLAAWQGGTWKYPDFPAVETVVPAGAVKESTLGPVKWGLGPESYWWPNIPFRDDYRATLHWLCLTVSVDGKLSHERRERFGFVEHVEGPYYYTVNGVRYTSFGDSNSYGQVGEYDCWTETPCFQPPHGQFKGCPETWRRYQQIGFNSMRLSTSLPTRYMLETADEAGYMLNPEGGSWGNGTAQFNIEHFGRQLQETIRASRNHPCVARYSLANESLPAGFEKTACPWRALVDAARAADDTRPLVFEVNPGVGTGPVPGMKGGHAQRMQHYDPVVPGGDHLRGMGECAWATEGMGPFADMAIQMRLCDWAHFAPWSWLNFWPNFLEGMNHQRHPWKTNDHGDRTDRVDGWRSPIVTSVQRALHPYLVLDRAQVEAQAPLPRAAPAAGQSGWPSRPPHYRAGSTVARAVELFNGGLSGRVIELHWQARWDTPEGAILREGRSGPIEVEPGFHATRCVEFSLPRTVACPRKLCLVLESVKAGKVLYHDDRFCLQIDPAQ